MLFARKDAPSNSTEADEEEEDDYGAVAIKRWRRRQHYKLASEAAQVGSISGGRSIGSCCGGGGGGACGKLNSLPLSFSLIAIENLYPENLKFFTVSFELLVATCLASCCSVS